MSEKYCCVTWQELGPELVQDKSDSLNAQIKELGIPRSVFASVIRVLNNMVNYCPVCGNNLLSKDVVEDVTIKRATPTPIKTGMTDPPSEVVEKVTPKTVRCAGCAGKGIMGIDQNGIKIKCMKCHGEGMFNAAKHDTTYNEKMAYKAETKVTDLREDLKIGENPVQGEAE